MQFSGQSRRPLEGIRIIDVTQALSGPFATMVLGDLGAEVLKIEPPKGEFTRTTPPVYLGDTSLYFIANNRNKRGLVINLKTVDGRKIMHDLVKKSDVVIYNYSPGVAKRLAIDHETLREINPRIITCSITGLGDRGPRAFQPLVDPVAQAIGGAISITGEEGGPPTRAGVATADISTGLYACIGIVSALQSRAVTGSGMKVETSLFHSQLSLLNYEAAFARYTGQSPKKKGTKHIGNAATQAFKTSDGWIMVDASFNHHFRALCEALELNHLADDPLFIDRASRSKNRAQLEPILERAFEEKTTDEWDAILSKKHLPSGPVLNVLDALNHAQAKEYKSVRKIGFRNEKVDVLTTPIWFDEDVDYPLADPPTLGQHTAPVLRNLLGYDESQIKALAESGVIEVASEIQA